MTALTAIETNYAGCRFRSRLEARWAVFFDHLEVPWQYEVQGYTVGPDGTPYLPDFWLPTMKLWVEVKGVLEDENLKTLVWAAGPAGLPLAPGEDRPLRIYPWRPRMLILGDVPMPGQAWLHTRIDVLAEELIAAQPVILWPLRSSKLSTYAIAGPTALNQVLVGESIEPGSRRAFVDGYPCPLPLDPHPRVSDAYRAARSARFEHGESGAPTSERLGAA